MPSDGSLSSDFKSDDKRSRHERRTVDVGEQEGEEEEEGRASGLVGEGWEVGVEVAVEAENSRVADDSGGVAGVLSVEADVEDDESEEVGEAGAVAE